MIKPVCPMFKGTRGWAQKFMWRNTLTIRAKAIIAQKLPSALEEMSSFLDSVREVRKEHDYPLGMIIDMDDTPMWFNMTSGMTVHSKGAKTVSIQSTGAEKQRLMVVLAATADGQMLSSMVIFKGNRNLKNIDVPRSWIVYVQAKGWMDSTLMDRWVREIYLKHTKQNQALLVMDSFSAHCAEIVNLLAKSNSKHTIIPGSWTSKLQPLDVSLNKHFKSIYRTEFSAHCHSQLSTMANSADRLKTASQQTVCDWIKKGLEYLPSYFWLSHSLSLSLSVPQTAACDHHPCMVPC